MQSVECDHCSACEMNGICSSLLPILILQLISETLITVLYNFARKTWLTTELPFCYNT